MKPYVYVLSACGPLFGPLACKRQQERIGTYARTHSSEPRGRGAVCRGITQKVKERGKYSKHESTAIPLSPLALLCVHVCLFNPPPSFLPLISM